MWWPFISRKADEEQSGLEFISRIPVNSIQDGDILVLTYSGTLSAEIYQRLREKVAETVEQKVQVVVLEQVRR